MSCWTDALLREGGAQEHCSPGTGLLKGGCGGVQSSLCWLPLSCSPREELSQGSWRGCWVEGPEAEAGQCGGRGGVSAVVTCRCEGWVLLDHPVVVDGLFPSPPSCSDPQLVVLWLRAIPAVSYWLFLFSSCCTPPVRPVTNTDRTGDSLCWLRSLRQSGSISKCCSHVGNPHFPQLLRRACGMEGSANPPGGRSSCASA